MGQPQKREWTVDLRARDPETGERYYDEDFAHQQSIEAHLECGTIQHREGGTFIIAPLRTQMQAPQDALAPGPTWVNVGLVVQHTFTPPVKPKQPSADENLRRVIAEQQAERAADTAPGLDPDDDLVYEDDDMRDEDERVVAEALDEGDEPTAQPVPMAPDPVIERPDMDVDAERSRLNPADLMPKVQ